MAKKNDDFFKEKKPWSEVKDELLGCYFKPYVSKILHTYRPLVYVDCFAGKGRFEDGQPGSPIIAMDIINKCKETTTMNTVQISTNFIDLNYADNLRESLKNYHGVNIVSGKYEDQIERLLSNKNGSNVFLYIDPYGIKALKCSLFDNFAMGRFNSIELLINMNSFGFIREACHALGTTFNERSVFDDLVEYDTTKMDASEKSISELNDIAGGDYWQSIIDSYRTNKIDGYEAEALFAEKYCNRLGQSFSYVLNMPLRIKRGQRPKYRLIHATNHKDGCLLMVDNICNRWQALQEIQTCGQLQLWDENCDNQIVDDEEIEKKVVEYFSKFYDRISLYEALASFFIKHGVICSTCIVKKIIKRLESENRIEIIRTPAKTEKGKPTSFMDEGKGKTIVVRWYR
jgi:three-Cys-motif partner protein